MMLIKGKKIPIGSTQPQLHVVVCEVGAPSPPDGFTKAGPVRNFELSTDHNCNNSSPCGAEDGFLFLILWPPTVTGLS